MTNAVLVIVCAAAAAGCLIGIPLGVLLARAARTAAAAGGCDGACTLAQLPRDREVVIRHRARRRPPEAARAAAHRAPDRQ